jgi:hypothetical protein
MSFLSFFKRRPDRQLNDLLMTHADALVGGTMDVDRLLEQYDSLVNSQVRSLIALADQLNRTLVDVNPSDQFVSQLRLQLLNEGYEFGSPGLWRRIRQLPPRTQLAAGIGGATLTAGIVLIASRSIPDARDLWRNRRTLLA